MKEKLATSALVFEMISLHGGPMIVLTENPVSSLNAEELNIKSFVNLVFLCSKMSNLCFMPERVQLPEKTAVNCSTL